MTEVRGDTDTTSERSYNELLSDQAEEWGEDDLDESVLEDLDEEPEDQDQEGKGRKSKRPGTDEVLRRLEDSDPEAAEVLRGMQRRMSQSINAERGLSERLARLEGRLEAQGGDEEGDSESTPVLPEGITEDNVQLFKQIADHLGYVPRDEIARREQERESETTTQRALREGVEQYGDDFGTVGPDGTVRLNPEIKDRLNQRLERLQDPKVGITPLDLYRLEFAPSPGERNAEGEQGSTSTPERRARRPGRSNVARRSTGGSDRRVRIYDPKREDSGESVMDRAWALARKRLAEG